MLQRLGYDEFFEQQMSRWSEPFVPGRVVGQHRRKWDVATAEGVVRAVLAGKRWADDHVVQLDDAQPAVGDWVALQAGSPETDPVIAHILTRKTELSRSSVARRGARQTMVANVDRVAVVAAFSVEEAGESVAKRSLHPRRLERYLAAIVAGRARPIVVINKADLVSDALEQVSRLQSRLSGVPVLAVNTVEPEGMTSLTALLGAGETIAFVGLSGVGKSSVINQLLNRDAQKVSAERGHDGRGRHTTTHRELFLSELGFCLIDTPGMREFALAESADNDLSAFSDILAFSQKCQFRDCTHGAEPGCGVIAAVRRGELEADRLGSYRTLSLELSQLKEQPARRKLVKADKRRVPQRTGRRWEED